ncbi:MAG: MBL fold metallo-hydrolase [Candidatus Kapaibacterium sp.]
MHRRAFLQSGLFAAAAVTCSSVPLLASATTGRPARPAPSTWNNDAVTSCWIGHSTILINMHGTVILTDPVLFDTVGVTLAGNTIGIRRLCAPALPLEDIPKPDLVLLSHAHMDHTDLATLEFITATYPGEVRCICARNTKDIVADLSWKSCRELDWWDSASVGDVSVTAVEVLHNGWRYPWERDRREGFIRTGRSYNGYVLRSRESSLLFAGDTAYTESLRELRGITIDTAFMPIGAYDGFLDNHCTPEQAVAMAAALDVRCIAPMHCQTFKQSAEPMREPMQRFLRELRRHERSSAWSDIGETIVARG